MNLHRVCTLCAFALILTIVATSPATAASLNNQSVEAATAAPLMTAEDLEKEDLVTRILRDEQDKLGRDYDPRYIERQQKELMSQSLEVLQLLHSGAEELTSITAQALGTSGEDLVFNALDTPCRVYDSRSTVGGAFSSGETRNMLVAGALGGGQGGAANCGIPLGIAEAIVANVLAVDPQAKGNFQAWPFGGSPGDSVINFAGPAGNINLINGIMLPICSVGVCTFDLSVRANFANSDFLLAVTGYFSRPERTQLNCINVVTTQSHTGTFSFVSPACSSDRELTGVGHNWTNGTTNVWFWEVSPETTRARCRGNVNRGGSSSNISCYATCCRVPGH